MSYKIGGAPLNVAVGLRRLGIDVHFISNIGSDWFGRKASDYLRANGVRSSLGVVKGTATRVAIVSHDKNRERYFEFFPGIAAENYLPESELTRLLSGAAKILYFGSFPFAKGDTLESFVKFARRMKRAGAKLIFDPNLRLQIFSSPAVAAKTCRQLAALSDVVRLNVDELLFLTYLPNVQDRTTTNIRRAAAGLAKMGPGEIFVTDGKAGSYIYADRQLEFSPPFKIKAVDTTGCGDAFTAAVISKGYCTRKRAEWSDVLSFANAAGAAAATKLGGADSMPARLLVESISKSRKSRRVTLTNSSRNDKYRRENYIATWPGR